MRRSEINRRIREAEACLAEHRWRLPPWGSWTPEDWRAHPDLSAYCREHQMGWDVTDFGAGDFSRKGLLLFCLRNGIQGRADERPYAEKLLIVREGQETPFHFHRVKMEDIVVRGGGTLMVAVKETDAQGRSLSEPAAVRCDGERRVVPADEPFRLREGQSITMHRGLAHRFYGAPGDGTVLVGEVSQVNDDWSDNFFLEPVGRFAAIEEDEPAERLLWNELPAG